MSKLPLPILAVGLLILLGVLSTGFFILPETKSAIVVRVGEPTAQYQDAGLHLKTPLVTSVEYIDKRNRELDQPEIEIIASNQERLIVDAFARYRVIDPLLFYQSVRTEEAGEGRLRSITEDAVRAVLGEVSVDDVVSTQRAALMLRIKELLTSRTRTFGVEIIDVKIRRADLPPQNSAAVFQRMITERQQLAQQIRAEGNEAAQQIRAQSEREATEIRSAAEEESQKIRGAADAERNAVFAAAYNKDQEFFAFSRSLIAYEEALKAGETTILLSPDSEFFSYFNDLNGGRR
jgi:membrane protease subunit HflC